MSAKKIFILIFSLLLVGAFAFVLVWGIINWNKVQEGMNGANLYTQEDLNKAYQDGYDDALLNAEGYEELILTYRQEISDLKKEIESLKKANSDVSAENENFKQQIADYEEQILNLNNEITRLNGLLEGYEDLKNGAYEVSFYIDRVLYATKVVEENNSVQDLSEPEETNEYEFLGWSLNKADVVDVTNYPITTNTIFYAVLVPKYEVNFVSQFAEYNPQYITEGKTATLPAELTNQGDFVFNGWTTNGSDSVDVETYTITADTTFTAMYSLYEPTSEELAKFDTLIDTGRTAGAYEVIGYVGHVDISDNSQVVDNKYFIFEINTVSSGKVFYYMVAFTNGYETILDVVADIDNAVLYQKSTGNDYKVTLTDVATLSTDLNNGELDVSDYAVELVNYYNEQTGEKVNMLKEGMVMINIVKSSDTNGNVTSQLPVIICVDSNGDITVDTTFDGTSFATFEDFAAAINN